MGNGASNDSKLADQGLDKKIQSIKKNDKPSKEYAPFTLQEIERMKVKYQKLDVNNKGFINMADFKYYPEIKTHFFKQRIYEIMENQLVDEGIQEIDFEYFVKIMTPFHPSTGKDLKYAFLFKVYDVDEDEVISIDDIKKCQKIFYQQTQSQRNQQFFGGALMGNENYLDKLAADIAKEFDFDKSGALDLDEFKQMVDDLDLLFRMNINF